MFTVVQRGWTSLMKASFEGHEKIVEVLLIGGAQPDNSGVVRYPVSSHNNISV